MIWVLPLSRTGFVPHFFLFIYNCHLILACIFGFFFIIIVIVSYMRFFSPLFLCVYCVCSSCLELLIQNMHRYFCSHGNCTDMVVTLACLLAEKKWMWEKKNCHCSCGWMASNSLLPEEYCKQLLQTCSWITTSSSQRSWKTRKL